MLPPAITMVVQDNLYIYGRKRVCKTCIYARTRARRAGDAHETTSLSAD